MTREEQDKLFDQFQEQPIYKTVRSNNGKSSLSQLSIEEHIERGRLMRSYSGSDVEYHCSHCNLDGIGNAFASKHFKKCWFHPDRFNLDSFLQDVMLGLTSRELSVKFSIPRARIMKYVRYIGNLNKNKHE
tara:strand:+ start:860 stop:1252 length:393 start_codon:yes stop_codon:yes gene_type:complete